MLYHATAQIVDNILSETNQGAPLPSFGSYRGAGRESAIGRQPLRFSCPRQRAQKNAFSESMPAWIAQRDDKVITPSRRTPEAGLDIFRPLR